MINYIGELAALGTSLLFAASSIFNTNAGRQVGSAIVNRTRLVFALAWLVLAHLLLQIPLPWQAGKERWLWLSASGIIGLAIGDAFLFQAFIWIGPRLSMLLMALAPFLSGILAWIFLGEILTIYQWAALFLALLGLILVIMDRRVGPGIKNADPKLYRAGLLAGVGAAIGQALGTILAKRGLAGDFPALSGSLIRMTAAMIVIWGIALLTRQGQHTFNQLTRYPRAAWYILLASLLGPFLGVTLSLFALQHTEVAIASILASLSPLVLLPVSFFIFKERFGWPSVVGTLMAMGGVALFFLV